MCTASSVACSSIARHAVTLTFDFQFCLALPADTRQMMNDTCIAPPMTARSHVLLLPSPLILFLLKIARTHAHAHANAHTIMIQRTNISSARNNFKQHFPVNTHELLQRVITSHTWFMTMTFNILPVSFISYAQSMTITGSFIPTLLTRQIQEILFFWASFLNAHTQACAFPNRVCAPVHLYARVRAACAHKPEARHAFLVFVRRGMGRGMFCILT